MEWIVDLLVGILAADAFFLFVFIIMYIIKERGKNGER